MVTPKREKAKEENKRVAFVTDFIWIQPVTYSNHSPTTQEIHIFPNFSLWKAFETFVNVVM